MNHLHPQTQHQQITVTALPEQYNPTISNSPTIINNTYYATGTVAASAAAAALAAAGGPPQTATISNHNNAQQNQNVTNRSQQGTNQQPKSYTAGRRRNSNLPTSSTGNIFYHDTNIQRKQVRYRLEYLGSLLNNFHNPTFKVKILKAKQLELNQDQDLAQQGNV